MFQIYLSLKILSVHEGWFYLFIYFKCTSSVGEAFPRLEVVNNAVGFMSNGKFKLKSSYMYFLLQDNWFLYLFMMSTTWFAFLIK